MRGSQILGRYRGNDQHKYRRMLQKTTEFPWWGKRMNAPQNFPFLVFQGWHPPAIFTGSVRVGGDPDRIMCATFMILIHFSRWLEKRRVFISCEFVARLGFPGLGPAETAAPMPSLTSLSPVFQAPVVSQFILPSGWTGPPSSCWCFVTVLSQVIGSLLAHSLLLPPCFHVHIQGCPGASRLPSGIICCLFRRLEEDFFTFLSVVGKRVFRGLWEGGTGSQGLTQARSYWLSESCYFVLRTGMSLLLLGTPEANHSEGVWSCPVWERTLRSLCLLAACLPTQPCTSCLGLPSIPWLTLPGAEQNLTAGACRGGRARGLAILK